MTTQLVREPVLPGLLELMDPLFRAPVSRETWGTLECMLTSLYGIVLKGGNPHAGREALVAKTRVMGLTGRCVPSMKTVNTRFAVPCPSLKNVAQFGELEVQRGLVASAIETNESLAHGRAIQFLNEKIRNHGWTSNEIYATIDGHGRPFYGKGHNIPGEISESDGKFTSNREYTHGAYRGKKTRVNGKIVSSGQPEYPGTLQKHEWLHLTIHHFETKESFPIGVILRFRSRMTLGTEVVQLLGKLRVVPSYLLVDREFSGHYELLEQLTRDLAPYGTAIVGPAINRPRDLLDCATLWREYKLNPIIVDGETIHVHVKPKAKGAELNFNFFMVNTVARPPKGAKLDKEDLAREVTPKGSANPLWQFNLLCSKNVSDEEAAGLLGLYKRRWACETYFQQLNMYLGASQSSNIVMRCQVYNIANLVSCYYGGWRADMTRRNRLVASKRVRPLYFKRDSKVDRTTFFTQLQAEIELYFLQPRR